MNKFIISLIVFNISIVAMDTTNKSNFTIKCEETRRFQQSLYRLGAQKRFERKKLNPKDFNALKKWSIDQLPKNKKKNLMGWSIKQNKSDKGFPFLCYKFGKSGEERYCVQDWLGNKVIYKNELSYNDLSEGLQKEITSWGKNKERNHGIITLMKNEKVHVYGKKKNFKIFSEEISNLDYRTENLLQRDQYWFTIDKLILIDNMKYIERCNLPIILTDVDQAQYYYSFKKDDTYYLFGVMLDSDAQDAEYEVTFCGKEYKFAQKLAEIKSDS